MQDNQIQHMVSRFLAWKLPAKFKPDNGISFNRVVNGGTEHQYYREPMGTNLLDAIQSTEMVRFMVEGLPDTAALVAGVERLKANQEDLTQHIMVQGLSSGKLRAQLTATQARLDEAAKNAAVRNLKQLIDDLEDMTEAEVAYFRLTPEAQKMRAFLAKQEGQPES